MEIIGNGIDIIEIGRVKKRCNVRALLIGSIQRMSKNILNKPYAS